MSKWSYINTGRGYRIAVAVHSIITSKSDSKVVIFCHALGSSSRHPFISGLEKQLYKKDYITVRFDFAGHGQSGGQVKHRRMKNFIEDLDSVVSHINIKYGVDKKNILLVGHSIGALTVLASSGINLKHYSRVVMIACNTDAKSKFKSLLYARKVKLLKNYSIVGSTHVSRDFWKDRQKYNVRKLVAAIRIPKLFICGTKDILNSPDESKQLFKWSRGKKKLKLIPGADHYYKSKSNILRVSDIILNWIHE